MSSLNEILDGIKKEGFELVRTEFMGLLGQAKDDSEEMAKKTAKKIEKWLIMLATGDLDEEEFGQLVEARKRTVKQYLNTLEIEARVLLERITIGLIDMAVSKILPVLRV